jgi:hypothetical protein
MQKLDEFDIIKLPLNVEDIRIRSLKRKIVKLTSLISVD